MDAGVAWSRGKSGSDAFDGAESTDETALRASRVRLASVLSSLGPVLCLYPAQSAQPLAGWRCWRRVAPSIDIDSDGPWEALAFIDVGGRVCWQLGLLPDADFYAWERALDALPTIQRDVPITAADGRRWGARRRWRACALRLFDCGGGELAASVPALSPTGSRVATQIALRRRAQLDLP